MNNKAQGGRRELKRQEWLKRMRAKIATDKNFRLRIPVELFEPEEIEGILLDFGFKPEDVRA